MDWSKIKEFVSSPVGITIMVGALIVIVLLIVFANTTVGKKAFNEVKLGLGGAKRSLLTLELHINKVEESAKLIEKKVAEVKQEVLSEVDVSLNQMDFFALSIYKVISEIPNAKVQKELESFYGLWKDKQKAIKETAGLKYSEIEEELKARDVEIARLKSEIEKIKQSFKEGLNAKESVEYGAREEGIND